MNKVMLIDGENCCTETLIKHLAFRKDWKVILILGANQNVSLQDYGVSIERCCITGHNAADFRIVAQACMYLFKLMYKEAVIVSKDTGYDESVRYLRFIGVKIRRLTPDYVISRFKLTGTYSAEELAEKDSKDKYRKKAFLIGEELEEYCANSRRIREKVDIVKYNKKEISSMYDRVVVARFIADKCKPDIELSVLLKRLVCEIGVSFNDETVRLFEDLCELRYIDIYRSKGSAIFKVRFNRKILNKYCAVNNAS